MKLFILLTCSLLFVMLVHSQNDSAKVQRYIYEVKYQLDSTDATNITTENFFLDVASDNSSRFASEGKLIKDSVVKYWTAQLAAGAKSVNLTKTIKSKYDFLIVKDAFGKMTYRDNAGSEYYYYDEDFTKISWKILPGFEDYHGMKTQKAITNYGGRSWFVLFTSEIPLIEGPYKFKNLPGFVVKAWDSRNHYIFSLVQSKSIVVIYDVELSAKSIKVTKSQMKKAVENYRNRPLSFSGTINNMSQNGQPVSQSEVEKRRMEKLKKENNWIEIN